MSSSTEPARPLAPHPDRLFPVDPGAREVARTIHEHVRDAPIISPHGHVPAEMLLDDAPFADPASLLITPDHYVLRLLHANGVALESLGRTPIDGYGTVPPGRATDGRATDGRATDSRATDSRAADGRAAWRELATHWDDFLGTPVRFWFETELHDVFGLTTAPSAADADEQYDLLDAALRQPSMRPRALFDRFGIEVLATTDDPASDLTAHAALAADPTFRGRVVPTFRADAVFDPSSPAWRHAVVSVGEAAGIDTGTHRGLLDALRARRQFFIARGATATDTGVIDAGSAPLSEADRERIHAAALRDPLQL